MFVVGFLIVLGFDALIILITSSIYACCTDLVDSSNFYQPSPSP